MARLSAYTVFLLIPYFSLSNLTSFEIKKHLSSSTSATNPHDWTEAPHTLKGCACKATTATTYIISLFLNLHNHLYYELEFNSFLVGTISFPTRSQSET